MKVIRNTFKAALLSAGLAFFGCSFSSRAATANVLVGNGGLVFTPATTNIAVNDRVLWTWAGSPHNVTSTNSAWVASPTQSTGATFTNTFSAAGTYFYYCTIHGTPTSGMKGAIIVTVANIPPTVAITNPAPGTVFAAPANVTIQASASDTDGTVAGVQFLIGSTNLGTVAVAPYAKVVNNLNAGSYTLSAIATDNSGATATNQVAISVVTPAPLLLSAAQSLPPARFKFTYAANTGLSYIIQTASNLNSPDWIILATNKAAASSINFTDINATLDNKFYRVGLLPNP